MSADNYLYVRRYRNRFAVTDESASADGPGPVRGNHTAKFFATLGEAIDYALTEYAEYGMSLQPGLRLSPALPREPQT